MFHIDNKQQFMAVDSTKQFSFAMSASKSLDAESGQSLLTEYHICPHSESKESRDILQWYISVFKIAIWAPFGNCWHLSYVHHKALISITFNRL